MKKNHCETTQENKTNLQEHSLQQNNKHSLHYAISIILMSSKMAEADCLLRRLERVFHCCSVCEAMEDYKEGYLMVWVNYL